MRVLVLCLLIRLCSTVECNWGNLTTVSRYFNTQEQFDVLSQGCTTITDAAVVMEPNYAGSFVFRGVTEISGSFSFGDLDRDSNLTSIDMPDLVSINATSSWKILRAPALTSVSFPELKTMSGSSLEINAAPNAKLDFPSLVTATSINVNGGLSSMIFPVLGSIDERLTLCPLTGCDSSSTSASGVVQYEVNFPSLIQVSSLKIDANILSLSMPNLVTVGRSTTAKETENVNFGLDLTQRGPVIIIDLPLLAEVTNRLDILGNFGSIRLRSLAKVPKVVNIHSHVQQSILLPELRVVGDFYATGNLTGVILPGLRNIQRMVLYQPPSSYDCSKEVTSHTEYFYINSQKPSYRFICNYTVDKKKSGLSGDVNVAIAAGVGFLVMMLIIYFWLWRRSHLKKKAKKSAEAAEYELQERYVAERCDSLAGTEVGSVRSERTVVQQGGRGYIHNGAADVVVR